MATTYYTLYAYNIINETVSNQNSLLLQHLRDRLLSPEDNFGNRCKPIRDGSQTEDVLSCYVPVSNVSKEIIGEMWRISPTKDVPKIPLSLFEKKSVSEDDVPIDAEVSETDKSRIDKHYFLITDTLLITTYLPSRATAFANYLNDLLSEIRGSHIFKFDSFIVLPTDIKLSDINSITFSDSLQLDSQGKKKLKSKYNLFKIGADGLKYLFDDFGNTNELINKKILSASMTLKLKKPRKMTVEDYTQKLSAFLKPLSIEDCHDISFKLNNGQEIKAMVIQAKKKVSIDDAVNLSSFQNIASEMKSYCKQLQE